MPEEYEVFDEEPRTNGRAEAKERYHKWMVDNQNIEILDRQCLPLEHLRIIIFYHRIK